MSASVGIRLLFTRHLPLRPSVSSVARRFVPQQRNFTMSPVASSAAQLASIDLSNYDPEQSRLMDERCILVDEQDRALGAADKKTCE